MNILFILGLVLFAATIVWVYVLFMSNAINDRPIQSYEEDDYIDAVSRCNKLYEQGLHAELQRYAQKELTKNYGNTDLRRILAKSLMASGEDQMAIMHYEAILAINPQDIEIQELLAQYYCENGPKSRAVELYEQILYWDSSNINAIEMLSKLYEETANFTKAIEMNKILLEAEINEEKALQLRYILGDLYTKINNIAEAYEQYRVIHQNDVDNLEVLMILADLAYQNKYWQDALTYYNKILSTVGDDFAILEKIVSIQEVLENWDSVILMLSKIISLEDETSASYIQHQNRLCEALIKNGQADEAIEIAKKMLVKFPNETSFVFMLGQAYCKTGEFEFGMNIYNKLLETTSTSQSGIIINCISNLICDWAQDLFDKGDYAKSFDKFFEALKYNEDNDDVYFRLGKCNYIIKSYQDACAYFKKAITIKPQNPLYYYALGCAYDELGMIKNSKLAFFDAINIDSTYVKARIGYAILLTKELEYAQSIEQFKEILKYLPNDPDTTYNLALAYELVGEEDRAVEYYKEVLNNAPEHKEAKHNLELILGHPYETDEATDNTQI